MDIAQFLEYCLSLPMTDESTPFDDDTLVVKVGGKMFAIASISDFGGVTLKCQPERVVTLCEEYEGIEGAYHMNKRHWITIATDGRFTDGFLHDMIENSYKLVIRGLPVASRKEIEDLLPQ